MPYSFSAVEASLPVSSSVDRTYAAQTTCSIADIHAVLVHLEEPQQSRSSSMGGSRSTIYNEVPGAARTTLLRMPVYRAPAVHVGTSYGSVSTCSLHHVG